MATGSSRCSRPVGYERWRWTSGPRCQNKANDATVPANHATPARIISGPIRLDSRSSDATTPHTMSTMPIDAVGNDQLDVAGLVRSPFRRDGEQQPPDNDHPAELSHG